MKFRLDPLAPNGISVVNTTLITQGGSTTSSGGTDVTITGEDYLTLAGQQITANPIDLDNLSATGTPSSSTFLRGDNTWATPAGSGDMSRATYDPQDIEADAFDVDNHTDGTTNKVFTATEKSKLSGIEENADVTDTTNVTAAGALMDSEVTNLSQVKAFSSSDYATAAQGSLADTAVQDLSDLGITASATELNYTDGVTSAIQTQLNAKAADADVVHDTGNETVGGIKTFSSFPITPSSAPTTDYQIANKKYVDDSVTAGGGYTDEQAQDAVGGILTDTTEIDFTYDDATPSITASVKSGSIDESKLDTSVNASLDLADSSVQPGDDVSDLNNDAGYTTNTGTVTSVAVSGSDGIEVDSGSPVTTDGTIALGVNKSTLLSHINVEDGADVTDATNVAAAGAVMESDTSTASMSFVIDEDNMASNSATKVPTQQSVKAYVDASGGGGSGDVTGPASSTDNAIARFDSTTGKVIQNSLVTVDDSGAITADGTVYSRNFSNIFPHSPGEGATLAELSTNYIYERTSGSGVTIDGVLLKDGEVDGRDVSADGSKLDGIESGADVTDTSNVQAALPSGTNGQVLKHNGTSWAAGTDNNTTYSEISEANIENASSSTVGLITGRRAEALLDNEASKSRTLTNKTLTSPVINTGVSGTAIKDEDNMASNSATHLATQQSIKAYVDTEVGGVTAADVGLGNVDNTSDATKNSASATLTNKTINGSNNTISNIGPAMRTGGFAIGSISGATLGSTGNKAITGLGFQPKLVRFTVLPSANATTDVMGIGAMTSAAQYCVASSDQASSSRNSSTSSCIGWITAGGSTFTLLASYVSMDSDGFTINVSAASSAFSVAWEAYA